MKKKNVLERHWCEIDLEALAHNFRLLQKKAGRAGIMAMVKANAYGHGAVGVARHLEHLGCRMLACAQVSEALDLRRAGLRLPILLLNPVFSFELVPAIRGGAEFSVGSREEILHLARAAARSRKPLRVHLKMDTGMGRLGCPPEETAALAELVRSSKGLELAAIMSHFASADSDPALTRAQWTLFRRYLPPGIPAHISNSAGLLAYPEMSCSLVRPGIALYGYNPVAGQISRLRPVLSWHARVLRVKQVPKGMTLSYGATFKAPRKLRVATVAVGYADGYSRRYSNRAVVLVNGRRCRVLGRVTMDMILVDIGQAGKVEPGTLVTLIGRQGRQAITAEDLARWSDTICYEVLTGIGVREPRMIA
jgi:alanine racemase